MLRVYETLRDFDGMDEGQRFWYFHWRRKEPYLLRQMHAVTDEGDDAGRLIETWLIENTDYTTDDDLEVIDDGDNIGNLGVMMRTDETVRTMLDEIVGFVAENQHRDWFKTDDDWWAGLRRGRRCTSIPDAPRGRDEYHYKCGVVEGMYTKLARMTGAEYYFIKTWLIPAKAEPVAIVTKGDSLAVVAT
jgi:hypothetical protein